MKPRGRDVTLVGTDMCWLVDVVSSDGEALWTGSVSLEKESSEYMVVILSIVQLIPGLGPDCVDCQRSNRPDNR